jgi:hypothetical protein
VTSGGAGADGELGAADGLGTAGAASGGSEHAVVNPATHSDASTAAHRGIRRVTIARLHPVMGLVRSMPALAWPARLAARPGTMIAVSAGFVATGATRGAETAIKRLALHRQH